MKRRAQKSGTSLERETKEELEREMYSLGELVEDRPKAMVRRVSMDEAKKAFRGQYCPVDGNVEVKGEVSFDILVPKLKPVKQRSINARAQVKMEQNLKTAAEKQVADRQAKSVGAKKSRGGSRFRRLRK